MAFTKVVALDVFFVVITSMSQNVVGALLVPIAIHVFGDKAEIGIYVGALNSANCFGQLLNFAIGAALVETSMGYKLPVLHSGIASLIGVLVTSSISGVASSSIPLRFNGTSLAKKTVPLARLIPCLLQLHVDSTVSKR